MKAAAITVELTQTPIDVMSYRDRICDPDVGAHCWFEGVTRRLTGERVTERLFYEAFEPMALAELRRIAHAACSEFGLHAIVLVHRLGEVPVGETSLLVGCSSARRASVFAAMPAILEELKRSVPVWKQEQFADGSTEWVHPQ